MPAAQAWMAFFASKPIYEQYVDITGISPSETGGTYSSYSSKVLGSWLGKGVNTLAVTPNWAPTRGYYDTPVQYPLLQEAVLAGSKSPQDAAKLVDSNWK
jgi:raffinose/stachyose/melibiose transport system substrate-binding protein